MTDTTGVCFLSYKRERAEEAKLVVEACRDRGIPIWQDIHDLAHGVTESELEKVLESPATACAVMFVTPEVERSDVIRETEAPMIFGRHLNADGFFVIPVAAGGLGYDDVPRVLGPRIGITNLAAFNILKAPSDPIDTNFAARLASRALDQRLSSVVTALPSEHAVSIQISTRVALPRETGHELRIDLSHRFNGRLATTGNWEAFILPAFADVVATLQRRASGRPVVLSGFPALPAAVALGAAFLSLGGVKVSWLQEQQNFGVDAEQWGLHFTPAPCGFVVRTAPQTASGTDIALLVSATTDVTDDFNRSREGLALRAIVHVAPPAPRPARMHLGPGEARDLACLAIDALKAAWTKYGTRGTVHLFLAVPAGVAFMIGQQLNTFATVQTYEHVPGAMPYQAAALLQPSI